MPMYSSSTFINQEVRIDSNQFQKCRFVNCTMIYGGTGPVSIVECHFENVTWALVGYAQNTLQFLIGMYHGSGEGGKQLIEGLFNSIRQGGPAQQPFAPPVTTPPEVAQT